jgi:hypothetical protein
MAVLSIESCAYVVDAGGHLGVFDVSNPRFPLQLGSTSVTNSRAIAGEGQHVYLVGNGLEVVDVSASNAPIVIASAPLPERSTCIAVAGGLGYVGMESFGVIVFDLSEPAAPRVVGGFDTPGTVPNIAVGAEHGYCTGGVRPILQFPVQCSTPNAVEISAFEASSVPEGILLVWRTSFEAEHLGFNVHRTRDGNSDYVRINLDRIPPPGPYRYLDTDVRVGTSYLYRLEAVDRRGGSEFFGPVQATAMAEAGSPHFRLLQSQPNPFVAGQGVTAIGFTLGEQIHTKLSVFDASGRLVRVLVDEPLGAGPHAAVWDGRNAGGGDTGSGIYYYRLEAGEFSEARALVKLR